MQYKFGSLIYIILLEYLKLQYGDFLLFSIVMIIFPIKWFLIYENSIIKLAWTQAFQHFTLENCVFLPCFLFFISYHIYTYHSTFHILTRFVVFDIFDRPYQVFFVLEKVFFFQIKTNIIFSATKEEKSLLNEHNLQFGPSP